MEGEKRGKKRGGQKGTGREERRDRQRKNGFVFTGILWSLKFHKLRSSRELISFTEIFEIGTSERTAPVISNLSLKKHL